MNPDISSQVGSDIDSCVAEIFDITHSRFYTFDTKDEKEINIHAEIDKQLRDRNEEVYDNIILLIEQDVKNLGIPLNNATKILIGELAMNLTLLHRARLTILGTSTFKDVPEKLKPIESSSKWGIRYKSFYNRVCFHNLIENSIPKLEKQIHIGLKALGLLPYQQLERQNVTIIQSLKQKYSERFEHQNEYCVKSEKELSKITKVQLSIKQESEAVSKPLSHEANLA